MRVTAPGHAGEKKETLLFLLFAPPTEWRKRGFKSGLGHLFIPFVCPVSRLDGGVRTKSEAAAAKGKGGEGEGGKVHFLHFQLLPSGSGEKEEGKWGESPKKWRASQKNSLLKNSKFFHTVFSTQEPILVLYR